MRRVLAILKYVPAVLCGLLVVGWMVSQFTVTRIHHSSRARPDRITTLKVDDGGIEFFQGGFLGVTSLPHTTLGAEFKQFSDKSAFSLWAVSYERD